MTDLAARYAVCQAALRSGDFSTDVAWAADAGASGLGVDALALARAGPAAGQALARSGLRASSLMGGVTPPLRSHRTKPAGEVADEVIAAVATCVRLGAPGILVTTGPREDLTFSEADRLCADWLQRVAPVAADAGVALLLEPVHPLLTWAGHVHTLAHGAELVAGIDGAGLVLDVGHLWWDRHFFTDLGDVIGLVGTVQVDDVDAEALAEYRYARTQLGDGVVPVAEMVQAIEAAGYAGYYENESAVRSHREERVSFFSEGRRRLGAWLSDQVQGHV